MRHRLAALALTSLTMCVAACAHDPGQDADAAPVAPAPQVSSFPTTPQGTFIDLNRPRPSLRLSAEEGLADISTPLDIGDWQVEHVLYGQAGNQDDLAFSSVSLGGTAHALAESLGMEDPYLCFRDSNGGGSCYRLTEAVDVLYTSGDVEATLCTIEGDIAIDDIDGCLEDAKGQPRYLGDFTVKPAQSPQSAPLCVATGGSATDDDGLVRVTVNHEGKCTQGDAYIARITGIPTGGEGTTLEIPVTNVADEQHTNTETTFTFAIADQPKQTQPLEVISEVEVEIISTQDALTPPSAIAIPVASGTK